MMSRTYLGFYGYFTDKLVFTTKLVDGLQVTIEAGPGPEDSRMVSPSTVSSPAMKTLIQPQV